MALLNALSVPRALATFPRKWLKARCQTTDNVGDCVYISGDMIGAVYQVTRADPTDITKMPCAGVIISKKSPIECKVQYLGEVFNLYTGLLPGKTLYVSTAGRVTSTPPVAPPLGVVFIQHIGNVVSSNTFVISLDFLMTKVLS
jgi:hypothetical protein